MKWLRFNNVFLALVQHFCLKEQKLDWIMGCILKQRNQKRQKKKTTKKPHTLQLPKTSSNWAEFSFTEELWELFFLFVKKKLSLECKFWFWLSVTACFEVFQTKINISITERIIVVLFRIIWLRVASNLRIYKVLLRPPRLWKSLTLFCFVNFL